MIRKCWHSAFLLAAVLLIAVACGGPTILSPYRALYGVKGVQSFRIGGEHSGVDFGETYGAPVLAAADGKVVQAFSYRTGCGIGINVSHHRWEPTLTKPIDSEFGYWTLYCHLSEVRVVKDQEVKRGQVIGLVGTSGSSDNVPHLHFELHTEYLAAGRGAGNLEYTEDPMKYIVGCFDPKKTYPVDRFVVTYPVQCNKD